MQRTLLFTFLRCAAAFVVAVVVARLVHAPLAGALVGCAMLCAVVFGIFHAFVFFHCSLQDAPPAPTRFVAHDASPAPQAS